MSLDEAAKKCGLSGLDATFDGVHGECCRLNRFAPVAREVITSLINLPRLKRVALIHFPLLLKKFLSVLPETIIRIVNASLAAGCFPSSLKHAVVTPLIKKPSMDPVDQVNYRPVSGLLFLSKLVEQLCCYNFQVKLGGGGGFRRTREPGSLGRKNSFLEFFAFFFLGGGAFTPFTYRHLPQSLS